MTETPNSPEPVSRFNKKAEGLLVAVGATAAVLAAVGTAAFTGASSGGGEKALPPVAGAVLPPVFGPEVPFPTPDAPTTMPTVPPAPPSEVPTAPRPSETPKPTETPKPRPKPTTPGSTNPYDKDVQAEAEADSNPCNHSETLSTPTAKTEKDAAACQAVMNRGRIALVAYDQKAAKVTALANGIQKGLRTDSGGLIKTKVVVVKPSVKAQHAYDKLPDCNEKPTAPHESVAALTNKVMNTSKFNYVVSYSAKSSCGPPGESHSAESTADINAAGNNLKGDTMVTKHEIGHLLNISHLGLVYKKDGTLPFHRQVQSGTSVLIDDHLKKAAYQEYGQFDPYANYDYLVNNYMGGADGAKPTPPFYAPQLEALLRPAVILGKKQPTAHWLTEDLTLTGPRIQNGEFAVVHLDKPIALQSDENKSDIKQHKENEKDEQSKEPARVLKKLNSLLIRPFFGLPEDPTAKGVTLTLTNRQSNDLVELGMLSVDPTDTLGTINFRIGKLNVVAKVKGADMEFQLLNN